MNEFRKRPLVIRILTSKLFWTLVFSVLVIGLFGMSQAGLSQKVQETQAQFVADSVRRSSVQCYAIEGRFPDTYEGVKYLEEHYGLIIDYERYVVYYESMGDNFIPQIHVVPIPQTSPIDEIGKFLGFTDAGSGTGR